MRRAWTYKGEIGRFRGDFFLGINRVSGDSGGFLKTKGINRGLRLSHTVELFFLGGTPFFGGGPPNSPYL